MSKAVVLADGSRVNLGAQTELTVDFGDGRRMLYLERGEALFSVAHDTTHPFVVRAGQGTITAVGTQFDVRRGLDRVTVTVTEGVVSVAPDTTSTAAPKPQPLAARWQPVQLAQGQQVTYDEAHDRGRVETAEVSAAEWATGRFQYRGVPIRYVIADLNRYRNDPIVLKDGAAGDYGFTGTVYVERTAEWLLSIERILPVQISRESDGHISIESRPSSEPEKSHDLPWESSQHGGVRAGTVIFPKVKRK